MKKIFSFKNVVITAAVVFVVMATLTFLYNDNSMVPLDPDGNYSYPDYCVGHEEEFITDSSSREYQMGLYLYDIKYIGEYGHFSMPKFDGTLSVYDTATNSYYNEALNLGFKLPNDWEAVSGTPKADAEYTYIYDFGAQSPDCKYYIGVKLHNIKADSIKVENETDYYGIATDPYYYKGYTDISNSNIFVGNRFCSFSACTNNKDDENGRVYIAKQILNENWVLLVEYHTPLDNRNTDVWDCFFSK